MKKIVFMTLITVFMISGSVFADTTFDSTGEVNGVVAANTIIAQYRTSNNVSLLTMATVSDYSAVTYHLNGDRVFGSSSGESVLYKLAAGKNAGDDYTTYPAATEGFASGATWDAL